MSEWFSSAWSSAVVLGIRAVALRARPLLETPAAYTRSLEKKKKWYKLQQADLSSKFRLQTKAREASTLHVCVERL